MSANGHVAGQLQLHRAVMLHVQIDKMKCITDTGTIQPLTDENDVGERPVANDDVVLMLLLQKVQAGFRAAARPKYDIQAL